MTHFNQAANSWDTPEKIKQNQTYSEKIKLNLKKNDFKNVLEVGCGTGLLGANFINGKNNFLGIDTSVGMLEIFDQKFKNNSSVKSKLLNLEENDLQDSDSRFDLIISSMAFHHLKNPENLLTKLKKMLNKDGVIAIFDLDQEDGSFHPDPKKMGVHHFGFSKQTTDSWAKDLGFNNSSREIVNVIKKETGDYPIFLAIFSTSL